MQAPVATGARSCTYATVAALVLHLKKQTGGVPTAIYTSRTSSSKPTDMRMSCLPLGELKLSLLEIKFAVFTPLMLHMYYTDDAMGRWAGTYGLPICSRAH